MIEVPNYKILKVLPSMPEDGETAHCIEEDLYYEYSIENGWQPCPAPLKGFDTGMTLYDINKNIISQAPYLDKAQIKDRIKLIDNFVSSIGSSYFMLLLNELKYYTVFVKSDKHPTTCGEEVIECLKSFECKIKDIILLEDNGAIEIWIEKDEEIYAMYFFNYEGGIVECLM